MRPKAEIGEKGAQTAIIVFSVAHDREADSTRDDLLDP
jgi:hypothetical protein